MSSRLDNVANELVRLSRENSRLLDRLSESEGRFRSISRSVLRLQEEQEARVARDLHDGIGQSLTALKIELELLERTAREERSPLAPGLASLRDLASACLEEVRQLARMLRPQMLDELGLAPTLRWLARNIHQRAKVEVEIHEEWGEDRGDPGVETLVFRFVQEALTNVVKHAGVDRARVFLRRDPRRALIRVEDRGQGFDAARALRPETEGGFGLRAMRDRVQSFGGSFAVRSAPGQGTVVRAEIPLASEKSGAA